MLDLQEITDIFLNFTAKEKPILQYPVKQRLGMRPQVVPKLQKHGSSFSIVNLSRFVTDFNRLPIGPINGDIEGAATVSSFALIGGG